MYSCNLYLIFQGLTFCGHRFLGKVQGQLLEIDFLPLKTRRIRKLNNTDITFVIYLLLVYLKLQKLTRQCYTKEASFSLHTKQVMQLAKPFR